MTTTGNIQPPRWPLKFLRFFVRKEYLEEIEGDMEEMFYDNVELLGLKKAKRIYTWEMVKLLRPILVKNLEGMERLNQYGMFKNYFKVSIRGLMKNPLNSAINIVGLSVAIGVCVYGYAFARWTYSTDQFHKNKSTVFLATVYANRDGTLQQYGITPRPLGELLREDFAQVKGVCRVEDRTAVVKHEDNVFNERVRYTDPEFLEMFTFPLKWGNPGTLADVNSIILSESMAIKYFGEENPIGQSLLLRFDLEHSKVFKVTGVAEKFPVSRTIDFGLLININNFRTSDPAYDFHDWSAVVKATFIQVNDPSDLKAVADGMEKYRKLQHEAVSEDRAIASFAFEPLATLHIRSEYIRDSMSRNSGSNYTTINFLIGVCLFMLVLACFNYINMAIVTTAKRLKEIGVRKSIGATRGVVITQFLTENVVITTFALFLGLAFGALVIVPWFEGLWNFSMGFTLNDPYLWMYLPAILIITGLASGIYPAFYISRFQVVGILKGSTKFGTGNLLTRVFLGIQMVFACLFISISVVFTQNTDFLARRPWGYDQHEALYTAVPDQLAFEQLRAVMAREPGVVSLAGSSQHLGKSNATAVLHFPDRDYTVDQFGMDPHYFETMGLHLAAGRAFNNHEGSDSRAVVVNELMVKNLGWESAVGKQFRIDSTSYEVIGVMKDFHANSFKSPIRPTIFKLADRKEYKYLVVKVRPGAELETFKTLQTKWAVLYPEIPFNGGFQEDVWGGYYVENEIYGHVWRVFATMAVVLASLGLYGLVTLNVSGRSKEFSVRRVLGAGMTNIAGNITQQYLLLFGVAIGLGGPLSYYAAKLILDFAFPVHVPVTVWGVSLGVVILIGILLTTVFTQVGKVVKANPVDGLKVE